MMNCTWDAGRWTHNLVWGSTIPGYAGLALSCMAEVVPADQAPGLQPYQAARGSHKISLMAGDCKDNLAMQHISSWLHFWQSADPCIRPKERRQDCIKSCWPEPSQGAFVAEQGSDPRLWGPGSHGESTRGRLPQCAPAPAQACREHRLLWWWISGGRHHYRPLPGVFTPDDDLL